MHGTDLFDVVRRARLPWRWNEEALRSLVYLLHTVGEETLHRDVIRVPAGSVGRIDGNRLELERQETLRRAFEGPPSTVEQAAGALQAVLAEVAGERPLLPLTGGLDSRTLLAALLVAGVRPVLWTIGGPEASDRRIASAVARRLGLEHKVVEVPPEDYFEHAPRITRLTGDVYRIHDWHSYLGFLGAGTTGAAPAIMGTAGKFTRIVYLPSVAVPVIDALPGAAVTGHLRLAARRWLRRYREPTEIVRRVGLEGGELASSLARLCDVPGSAWSRLRFLFVGHRARHFTGLGVHLAAQSVRCAAPYLDARWVGAAARLPTVDCRYESFHRTFIHELHPELAPLPTEREPSVARRLPWPGQRRKSLRVSREVPSYSPFRRVLELPACQALLESEDLDSHATREQRARALERRDVATCNLLLTLHFAGAAARESTR